MPRKPKVEKRTVTVVVNGTPVTVTLHPPAGSRRSWYAYWNGLVASKSTGQHDFTEAVKVAENMVRNNGRRATLQDTSLTDEEFETIQRHHFSKKRGQAAQVRAAKTLKDCLEAIVAFREISGVSPVARATPADCERFQHRALEMKRNWRTCDKERDRSGKAGPRSRHHSSEDRVGPVRANTVLKWSRALQAAYERANRNGGKKCVRGVVDDKKLLTANPWKCFTWIEGDEPSIRQFSGSELVSLLDYLEARWPGVTVATALAKVFLWSWGRRMEVASLTWQSLRVVGEEYHFEVVGKWGVDKWFRIPTGLYQELLRLRTDSPYVFAAYNQQLREFYLRARPGAAEAVSTEFRPMNLADWFHNRVVDWSGSTPGGHATTHVFRKTTLQYARTGEDVSQQVANDARLGASVMMTHYAKESDPERREQSNRTYRRILAALLAISPEAAERYGYVKAAPKTTRELLAEAYAAEDWDQVARLSKELQSQRPRAS